MKNQESFQPGVIYHLFNRGNNHERIFIENKNYEYFLFLAQKYLLKISNIYAYCLIPNHFHILVGIKMFKYLPEEYKTGRKKLHQPFSNFFNAYAKAINKKYDRRGSLFQEHLKRNIIDTDEYFKNVVLYIHLNSNHHRLNLSYENYPFSSYPDYVNRTESFIDKGYVIDLFDNMDNFVYLHKQKKINMDLLDDLNDLDD